MEEIDRDIEAGRNGLAARKLAALLARKPGADDAAYLLGTCEKARRRPEAAALAWARVPPGSSFASLAIESRIQLHMDGGRLADVEQVIKDMLEDPRFDGLDLPALFGPFYLLQGRVEEAERLIEARWNHINKSGEGASEQAINLVRVHIELQGETTSPEATRELLDRAGRLAPDDDRIWLGKANLAVRTGSYDEAARWLGDCLRRRRDDVSVWRSRLNWAVAVGRVAEAREAMEHLPAAEFTPAQVEKLAARIAAQCGNAAKERLALERVIAADPADFTALARLAELAVKDGRPDRAALLHHKRTEIERLKARYRKLYERYQPQRDAAEMARLAEQLGRLFEARAFLTVALAVDQDRVDLQSDLARLDRNAGPVDHSGRPLVERFAAELDDLGRPADANSP